MKRTLLFAPARAKAVVVALACILPTAAVLLGLGMMTSMPARGQNIGACSPALGEAYLDVGNVRARILNNGNLIYRGEPHVYNVPKGSTSNAVFAQGFWIGGMVDGTLRMAGTRYGPYEFWPGPLDEAGNPPVDCAPFDRLFKISKADVEAYEATGIAGPDLADWPTGLGAPTLDAAGHEIDLSVLPLAVRQDRRIDLAAGERPSFLGDQMIWWVMNDAGNVHGDSEAPPVGVEVQGLAFAFDEPGAVGNATFYRYTITKKGASSLEDAYVSIFSDPDLGDFGDDYVGSDSTLGLGYVWNSDNFDGGGEGYGTPPPALGYDFFQGPLVASPGSSARDGPTVVPGYKNVPVTTVLYYNNGGGVTEDPVVAEDYYNYMRGRWKDGKPVTVGGNGRDFSTTPTRFMFSGDAANCGFWTECNADGQGSKIPPGDRRFVISSGPFRIEAGATQRILVGMVYARGEDHFDSVTAMKEADAALQRFVDSWFTEWPDLTEQAPTSVPTLISPADGVEGQPVRLVLTWQCPEDVIGCMVQLASDPEFREPMVAPISLQEPRFEFGLEANQTYWWRARALGRNDLPGPWSPTQSFSTGDKDLAGAIVDFQAVSNAAGPLDPPECGAFDIGGSGFPLVACGRDRPDGARQQAGGGLASGQGWGLHAGGAAAAFGPVTSGTTYLGRSARGRTPLGLAFFDYEIRFTAAGGKAKKAFQDGTVMDVPFEVWRIGQGTPEDPSDDVRLIPYVNDVNTAGVFDIGGDHAISPGSDDPHSDWIYFMLPEDASPGQAGYEAFFAGTGGRNPLELWVRQVLVCVDCGTGPSYPQPYPQVGTVFRIVTDPQPTPILAAPGSGAVVYGDSTRFYFTTAAGLPVDLQFSEDVSFSPIAVLHGVSSGDYVSVPGPGVYWWRVGTEAFGWSDAWQVQFVPATDTEDGAGLPASFALDPAYPNPFNPVTTIRYALPVSSPTRLEVFDVLGRMVAVLVDDAVVAAGFHEARFDASRLASGVYLVALRAGRWFQTRSVVLAK